MVGGLLALGVSLTGCGGHGNTSEAASPPPPRPSVSTLIGQRSPVSASERLDCGHPIDVMQAPDPGTLTVGQAIALAHVDRQSWGDSAAPHRLETKTPLEVRVGRASTLAVPWSWRHRVAFRWGTNAQETSWTTRLEVPPCRRGWGKRPWMAFPGLVAFERPGCVPLRVTVAGRTTVLRVALGRTARCPGV
jgi:hypothetical protein